MSEFGPNILKDGYLILPVTELSISSRFLIISQVLRYLFDLSIYNSNITKEKKSSSQK
jgi:uncharacterized protein YpmS